jgi:error-prone DNA polymerase
MALLDRDGVYGAPRFHMAAKKTDIKAHIGSEITVTVGNGHASRITHHGSRITGHASRITHHASLFILHL